MRGGARRSPVEGLPDNLFRAAFEASTLPMWLYDAQTLGVLAANDRALDYFGCRPEQFPALPETAPTAGGAGSLRYHRKPDGAIITMRLETSPVEIDGRRVQLAIAIDATAETRALAESARYRGLLDVTTEWFWEADAGLLISVLSPEYSAATGLPPQSLLGRRLEEGGAGGADEGAAPRLTIEAHGRFRDLVFMVPGADGNAVWLALGGMPVIDPDGRFRGYSGVGRVVTAEVEANLALRRREQRYARFFDVAPVWFWEMDDGYRLTYVSPSSRRALGLAIDDYRGRRLSETPGVTIEPERGRRVRAAQSARQPYADFLYTRKRRDGTTVWINTCGAPVFDEDGSFRGYCGIARDVTAQIEAEQALNERDRRFQRLFESASDWLWQTGPGGQFTYTSPNFEVLYGLAVADLIGRRLSDAEGVTIDPESGRRVLAAMKTRQPIRDFVYSHKFPDGRQVWIKTNGIAVFDSDGAYQGYFGVSKDVTTEIEAGRVLRESEQQFKELLEAAADYYWEQDTRYCYTYLSPAYETLLGVPVAHSLGKRLSELPEVSIDPEMGRMALRAMKVKKPYRDFVFSRKSTAGRRHWFKSSAVPIFDRNGVFGGYRGVGAEVTQQVEAEATARLAQQRLKEAVAHVSQPIVVFDAEDRVVGFNQAFTDLHQARNTNTPVCQGVSFRELVEWQLRFGFYAEDAEDAEDADVDLETLLTHHLSEAEHTYRLGDGRWMLVVYRRLPGDGRVGLWTDVTALKRAEAERRALERQILHSQRLEALGTLAGGVAHEINNALVPVLALTKMAARDLPLDSRERRNLDTALQSSGRIRDLVKRILAFSRKGEDRHRESVDVAIVLSEALQMMRATVPANIRLETAIESAPRVMGDPNQIYQVIVNLVSNAAQAIGPAMGTITVALQSDPDCAQLRLSVSDTGCGMDETTKARIFEPFFTTKDVGEGTGLGLSVAHGIVIDHGGSIEVASAPGRGTRFDVFLPNEPAEAPAPLQDAPARDTVAGAP
jgi:PAS domain S-box-containing protein